MSTVTRERDGNRYSSLNARFSPVPDCDVAVVGAGPYGLSAASHLKAKGLDVRVFGQPMEFWSNKMPAGMLLRSPRGACSLSDPDSALTLEAYEAAAGAKPAAPLPLETFVAYGRWFQNQLGSALNTSSVASVNRVGAMFNIVLEDGTAVRTRRVVVAAGVAPFRRIPAVFSRLPMEQASHCYEGRKIPGFRGKRVAVIGAGQSALESAALLREGGAQVEVIARIPRLRWIGRHSWLHHLGPLSKILYSKYDVGPAGISRLVSMPRVLYHLPLGPLKEKIRTRAVRPAGSRWLPDRLSSVTISTSTTVRAATSVGDEVLLKLDDGSERRFDHILLGTGYSVDIAKYSFLSADLLAEIRRLNGYPQLELGFQSSVPGLHFIGATAAQKFGPLLYFVAGTQFASKQLSSYISRSGVKQPA